MDRNFTNMDNEFNIPIPRKFYNNEILCRTIGITPRDISRIAKKGSIDRATVAKALNGDENIVLRKLMKVVEASELAYEQVFDGDFYRHHFPKQSPEKSNSMKVRE